MKKILLLPLLFIVTNSVADELHNFDQVKSAVMTGKSIRIAIDFSKCSTAKKDATPFKYSIGVFTPNEIIVTNEGNIAASLTHFTLNDTSVPGKPVYQFVRYTITDDNNIDVSSQLLDATNYASISDKSSFNCKIDTSAKIYV